jgi:predicted transglutaminase-like cysteine proteinase
VSLAYTTVQDPLAQCDQFHANGENFAGSHFNTFHGAVILPSLRNLPIRRPVFGLIACALAFWMVAVAYGAADFDRLLVSLTQRWGAGASTKFNAWRAVVAGAATLPDTDRIKRANDFFNRQMQFGEDIAIWGQLDYWATPMESLGKGAGDCEDFAIAKYFTLKEMGVASEKLRLIYVRAKTGSAESSQSQAHMVLAYYPQPEAEPLVLDNLIGEIRPASRRPDLVPVFSFNSEGVYTGASARDAGATVGVGRLSRWEDLLKRARLEGFE